jgi:alginate O-acetyltransferase complex protein AlgI
MTSSGDLYSYFLNLVLLAPLVLLLRIVFPVSTAIRTSLIAVGAYAMFCAAPRFLMFYTSYWVAVFVLQGFAGMLARKPPNRISPVLTVAIIVSALAPLLLWKLFPDRSLTIFTANASQLFWSVFPSLGYVDALVGIAEPLGLSFAVFRAVDLIAKVRLGLLSSLSLGRVLYFGFFPPVLALGPIVEYEETRTEGNLSRAPNPGDLAVGGFRFAVGSLKIFLLAHLFSTFAAFAWQGGHASTGALWLALFSYGIYFYLNFSGYSDLAIGIARIYGFRLKENFNNPYFKTNPQDFWNSWHMSLTRWVQRYVFVPLGGMRPNRQYVAIFMTIMVIALWHGISWSLVVFGVYHGLIVVIHRKITTGYGRVIKKRSDSTPIRIGKMLLVFSYVSLSFPLLVLPIREALLFYPMLVGIR